jgi:mxaD protein
MTNSSTGAEPKVKVTADLVVPAQKLWGVLSDFSNLSWAPPVHHVEYEGEGPGMVRRMYVTENAPGIVEQLESLDEENLTIVYTVRDNNPLPVEDYVATMVITEAGPDACRLDWSCSFEPREGVTEEQAVTFVTSFYGALVTAIKDAVEAED